MRFALILLAVLMTAASAQKIDVNFGTVTAEYLRVDSVATFNDSTRIESAFIDWMSLTGAGHFWGVTDFDSLVTFQERIELNAVREANAAYAYGLDLQGTGFFSGGAAQKTYLANFEGTRVAADTMSGDSRDRLIGGSYGNYAVNDAASNAHGIGLNVRNRAGGFLATIKGCEMQVNNNSGASATNLYAGTFLVENYGTLSDIACGVLIELRNEGASATGEFGLKISNTDNSTANAADAAIFITDAGTNTGWDYGVNMIGSTIGTAEIAGQNGETWSNATNGYWNAGESAVLAASYNFATPAMVAGTADAITIDFTPNMPTIAAGLRVTFIAEAANTGAATLAVDGGDAKAIVESGDGSALEANDIRSGSMVDLVYDGTSWQQVSQSGN